MISTNTNNNDTNTSSSAYNSKMKAVVITAITVTTVLLIVIADTIIGKPHFSAARSEVVGRPVAAMLACLGCGFRGWDLELKGLGVGV